MSDKKNLPKILTRVSAGVTLVTVAAMPVTWAAAALLLDIRLALLGVVLIPTAALAYGVMKGFAQLAGSSDTPSAGDPS